MRYHFRKDVARRHAVVKQLPVRQLFKALLTVPTFQSAYIVSYLMLSRYSATVLRHRCGYTASARSVNRYFHVSRWAFRAHAFRGFIYGLRRTTW